MGRVEYRTYSIDFTEDIGAMGRFIMLYRDLFHSWAEDGIKFQCTITHFDKPLPNKNGSKYRHYEETYDEINDKRMREGFHINNGILTIHCKPEDFKRMLSEINYVTVSSTRKHSRKTYKYVVGTR